MLATRQGPWNQRASNVEVIENKQRISHRRQKKGMEGHWSLAVKEHGRQKPRHSPPATQVCDAGKVNFSFLTSKMGLIIFSLCEHEMKPGFCFLWLPYMSPMLQNPAFFIIPPKHCDSLCLNTWSISGSTSMPSFHLKNF